MPTYALLGATGATGSAVLRCLLETPPKDLSLNILVRNKAKLLTQFHDLESTKAFKLNIFEGTPDDGTPLKQCLKGAEVVHMCIATNESKPGLSLAQDTTKAIISALEQLRKEAGAAYTKPTILMLRSAGINEKFQSGREWGKLVGHFVLHYVYTDLQLACDLLSSKVQEAPGLFDYIIVDPPSLHNADGIARTGHKLVVDEMPPPCLMYADLGAAFCEIAERKDEFVGEAVGVGATGEVTQTWGVLLGYLGQGLKSRVIG
ncbi:hypothetical protein KC343_g4952 [Hortaea werneckii]|uniref:NAD(P)-binding domain-containing protein n=1 Tax=Hortaea werneckii TaxID=91943 RepID=A0A3M7GZM4_HORWE|nr:hypothetical protein KC352_g19732 [Hortaea werneckii]KAI7572280.1 hypothetical protein KC317_g900 [Hortaea werneckii]KAI7611382.1 hypothetical protein KC346_g8317 [Hortaea werneckii]KAI7629926.1 hypothetical protein KC343_g4952 [Hortaea werneckii]KAI7664543.1 hypothetical protein KC319_g7446 [Hortaea werneckii]